MWFPSERTHSPDSAEATLAAAPMIRSGVSCESSEEEDAHVMILGCDAEAFKHSKGVSGLGFGLMLLSCWTAAGGISLGPVQPVGLDSFVLGQISAGLCGLF